MALATANKIHFYQIEFVLIDANVVRIAVNQVLIYSNSIQ